MCQLSSTKRWWCSLWEEQSFHFSLISHSQNGTFAQQFRFFFSTLMHISGPLWAEYWMLYSINFVLKIGHLARHLKSSTGTGLNWFWFPLRQHPKFSFFFFFCVASQQKLQSFCRPIVCFTFPKPVENVTAFYFAKNKNVIKWKYNSKTFRLCVKTSKKTEEKD